MHCRHTRRCCGSLRRLHPKPWGGNHVTMDWQCCPLSLLPPWPWLLGRGVFWGEQPWWTLLREPDWPQAASVLWTHSKCTLPCVFFPQSSSHRCKVRVEVIMTPVAHVTAHKIENHFLQFLQKYLKKIWKIVLITLSLKWLIKRRDKRQCIFLMTQEHKVPANLPAAASHAPSSVEERAASRAGDSKDFATLSGHLCWHQKCSPVLECVPKAEHKYSCLPLLQIPHLCWAFWLEINHQGKELSLRAALLSSLSAALALQIEFWLLFSACIVDNPLRPCRLTLPALCRWMLPPHLLIKKGCVGRDFHLPSGTVWKFFYKLVVITAKQSSEKLHKVVLMDFITGCTLLFFYFTGSTLTDLIRDYFQFEGIFKSRSRLRYFFSEAVKKFNMLLSCMKQK